MVRRGTTVVLVLLATVLLPAAAHARPAAGWWGGSAADGYDVTFQVVESGGRSVVTDVSTRCGRLIVTADDDWFIAAASRPSAAAIGRDGRIARGRRIDEFGLVSDVTILRGRLGRRAGYVHPPVFGDGCTSRLGWDDRIPVRALAAPPRPPIADGRWVLTGPPETGTELSFVVTGGGARTSTMSGSLGGHLRATPFGPLPCQSLGDVIDEAAIGGDGGFSVASPAHSPGDTSKLLTGRFTGATSAAGTYELQTVGDTRGFDECMTGVWPWTAELVEPEPPPVGVLPAPARQLNWVALGDSYSSGEGVRPFFPGTEGRRNKCHRSRDAYSQVFDLPGYVFWQRMFLACSGAITDNVGRAGGGGVEGTPQYDEPGVQLARLTPQEWAQVDLVTMTIGGNDAGFGPVLTQCVFLSCQKGKRAQKILSRLLHVMPGRLRSTYATLRALAPNATIVVLGYPNLFPSDREFRSRCDLKRTLSAPKRRFMRELGQQVATILRDETRAAGLLYTDPRDEFAGHEPCGDKQEWINAIVRRKLRELPEGLNPTSMTSFHPNRLGQKAYADVLRDFLRCALSSPWPYNPDTGLPRNPEPGAAGPRCG